MKAAFLFACPESTAKPFLGVTLRSSVMGQGEPQVGKEARKGILSEWFRGVHYIPPPFPPLPRPLGRVGRAVTPYGKRKGVSAEGFPAAWRLPPSPPGMSLEEGGSHVWGGARE